jgi:hypothetical protein
MACSAWGQGLTVLPAAGHHLGAATAPEPGKWIVFSEGFMPIQPVLVDGGKTILWEGKPGTYAVIYLPPGDGQPVVQQVKLGEKEPSPDPPVPPVPPGERWAVIWEESSQRTPQQAALYAALRKQLEPNKLFVLDVSSPGAKWEPYSKQLPANQTLPALQILAGQKQVRAVACPSSVDGVKQELAK